MNPTQHKHDTSFFLAVTGGDPFSRGRASLGTTYAGTYCRYLSLLYYLLYSVHTYLLLKAWIKLGSWFFTTWSVSLPQFGDHAWVQLDLDDERLWDGPEMGDNLA
jgi:hypothetical protein